jgi:methylglyoxal synthase
MTWFWGLTIIFLWSSLAAIIREASVKCLDIDRATKDLLGLCCVSFLPFALPYLTTRILLKEYDESKKLREKLNTDLERKKEALNGKINELDNIIQKHKSIDSEVNDE